MRLSRLQHLETGDVPDRFGILSADDTQAGQGPSAWEISQLGEQMRLAARLQQGFLPRRLPEVGPARFAVLFRPAGWLSGDFYDVTRLDETHVGFYVVDAVGHGLPAALLTMFIKKALQTKRVSGNTYQIVPPHIALAELNTDICDQDLASCSFCTAVYCILDVVAQTLTYARAGHPSPTLIRADGSIEPLPGEGKLLGIFPDAQFDSHTLYLSPGDRLVLHTDGAEQVFSFDGIGPDERPFTDIVRPWAALPRQKLLMEMTGAMDDAIGYDDPLDDITVMVMDFEHPGAMGPPVA